MDFTIKIVDTGATRYVLNPQKIVLGRQYDHKADNIIIERPLAEKDSICTMIITNQFGAVVDHIIMDNDNYSIENVVSQNRLIKIGFSFARKDGYIKNSEIILGEFLPAQKPDGFVPVEPQQKQNIDFLTRYGFADSRLNANRIEFLNMSGEVVVSYDLSPFTQEQSDLSETDETAETFVKGKKTSNLLNDGEDGVSPYATKDYVDRHSSKIDVDTEMSDTSENAVQNKIIKQYVDDIADGKLNIDNLYFERLIGTAEHPINFAKDMEYGKAYICSGQYDIINEITSGIGAGVETIKIQSQPMLTLRYDPYTPNYGSVFLFGANVAEFGSGRILQISPSYYGFVRISYNLTTGALTKIEYGMLLKKINGLSVNLTAQNGIYAPVEGGTAGQVLKSSGENNAPVWGDPEAGGAKIIWRTW